jgi:thiol peroxidase
MSQITLKDKKINTYGSLPETGEKAPHFELVRTDLSTATLNDFRGKRIIMNIFPSVDNGVCATSVRNFNESVRKLNNTTLLSISRDLPYTQKRFVTDEGLDNITNLSDFRQGDFGKDYGVEMIDGIMTGFLSRVVIVLDEEGIVLHSQQVPDISQEPDYLAALKVLL